MKKEDKYNCFIGEKTFNGSWEVSQISDKQMKLSRLTESKVDYCSKGLNSLLVYFDNLRNEKINKNGTKNYSANSFKKYDDETFFIYPNRSGICFRFELIKEENNLLNIKAI
jgi:hypothetical protein